MKRILMSLIATVLLFAMVFSLTSCGGPEKKLEKVQDKMSDDVIEGIEAFYDNLENKPANLGSTTDVQIRLGAPILTMLNTLLKDDVSFLNDFVLRGDITVMGNQSQSITEIRYLDEAIATLDVFADTEKGKVYVSIPQFIGKTLLLDADTVGMSDILAPIADILQQGEVDIRDFLPTKEETVALYQKYDTMVRSYLKTLATEEVTVEANGVKQTAMAYTNSFTKATLAEAAKAILTSVKADETVKSFLDKIDAEVKKTVAELEKQGMDVSASDETVYEAFVAEIDELLVEIEKDIADSSEDVIFAYTLYVSGKTDVIGSKFTWTDDDKENKEFHILTATEDTKTGIDVAFLEKDVPAANVTALVTDTEGVVSGEMEVFVGGEAVAAFAAEDFDTEQLKNGRFIGKLTVIPAEKMIEGLQQLVSEMGFETDVRTVLANSEIRMTGSVENGVNTVEIAFVMSDVEQIALVVKTKIKTLEDGATMSEPLDGFETDLDAWVAEITPERINQVIAESNLPETVKQIIGFVLAISTIQ